jgi:hypothetical protein
MLRTFAMKLAARMALLLALLLGTATLGLAEVAGDDAHLELEPGNGALQRQIATTSVAQVQRCGECKRTRKGRMFMNASVAPRMHQAGAHCLCCLRHAPPGRERGAYLHVLRRSSSLDLAPH